MSRLPISLATQPHAFSWSNEPPQWNAEPSFSGTTAPDTDYWQRTHYGFRRDNGHFLYAPVEEDFVLTGHVEFAPTAQYDQCGLMVRVDADTWIKCSVETESETLSRLGSVVTNFGFSDWATQDVAATTREVWYRIARTGEDFVLDWAAKREAWQQMRVTHLHHCPAEVAVGFYACSPTGQGFSWTLPELDIRQAGL